MARQAIDARAFLPMAIDAPTHVRRVEDLLGHGHGPDVTVTGLAADSRSRVRLVLEVHHRAGRHGIHVSPQQRLALTAVVESHERHHLRVIGRLAAVAARADRHGG